MNCWNVYVYFNDVLQSTPTSRTSLYSLPFTKRIGGVVFLDHFIAIVFCGANVGNIFVVIPQNLSLIESRIINNYTSTRTNIISKISHVYSVVSNEVTSTCYRANNVSRGMHYLFFESNHLPIIQAIGPMKISEIFKEVCDFHRAQAVIFTAKEQNCTVNDISSFLSIPILAIATNFIDSYQEQCCDFFSHVSHLMKHHDNIQICIKYLPNVESLFLDLCNEEKVTYFNSYYERKFAEKVSNLPQSVTEKCCARVGLMGNPSDGFEGKTLSYLIDNFAANVTISDNGTRDKIEIHDSLVLDGFDGLLMHTANFVSVSVYRLFR